MASIVCQYHEEFEIELVRLGQDLRAAEDPASNMTLRRLWILFKALPDRNMVAFKANKCGDDQKRWGESEHILANIFDAIRALDYTVRAVNAKSPGEKPKPHPRPGAVRHQGKMVDRFPGKTIYDKGH